MPDDSRLNWHFAYGSNLDPESMRRRGVCVHDHARAVLPGYRLAFDLDFHLFRHEPRMANLRRDAEATAHGVAHLIREADMAALDEMEFIYQRVDVELTFYDGRTVSGTTYIGRDPRFLDAEAPPSERYLTILKNGARNANLDPSFCESLEALRGMPLPPDPGTPRTLVELVEPREYSHQEISSHDTLAAFGGFVFDFAASPSVVGTRLFTGADTTGFLLSRILDLPRPQTPEQMQPRHLAWMNLALHDFARVARPVGVVKGGLAASLSPGRLQEA